METLSPLLFPPVCVLCGDRTERVAAKETTGDEGSRKFETFCRVCETSLTQSTPMMRTACDDCGWPRGARSDSAAVSSELSACPKCHARESPHRFDRITPLYRYHDAARDAVVAAKYPRNAVVARELAKALAARCRSRWPDLGGALSKADRPIVTSVPSPWIRQVRRGGSGTRLLAQYTASNLNLHYVTLLHTTRPIAKQALLDDEARRVNVHGAFQIRSRWLNRLQGREVLIVDDVMTTGATADEIATILHDAGVARVSLAVAALAMREK